jgi:hypothetical protein
VPDKDAENTRMRREVAELRQEKEISSLSDDRHHCMDRQDPNGAFP